MSKEKRVLFIVGDVVVAPSDNILSSADRYFDHLGFASAACCLSVSQEPSQTDINPDGDLELVSAFAMDEEFDDARSSEMYTTQTEDIDTDIDSGLD
ncbi:hypothetical protein E4T45_13511, partial [Aureobasidium sp. EXF-8846]